MKSALIGTAGWSLPRAEQEEFPGTGSHLERYTRRLQAAEINSSFHRSHRAATWLRWRDSVPPGFLFSVKMPKTITHTSRLENSDELVSAFLSEISVLEAHVGCILVQLPPKLEFRAEIAEVFFGKLRAQATVSIACEPRHESWFQPEADQLLASHAVARVAADPPRVAGGMLPGGWRGLSYYRLHGSPTIYRSSYDAAFLEALAFQVRQDAEAERRVWVIFDNTTLGAATRNALDLAELLSTAAKSAPDAKPGDH